MKTKLFTLMFAIVASMNLWAADSGRCGDNLKWTLDDNGTLTISGTGSMTNYNSLGSSPWYNNSNVKKVIINSGVKSIGMFAFNNCSSMTSVTFSNSITSIGSSAFSGCSGLTSITIPNSVTFIGNSAFEGCSGLKSVNIPDSVTSIRDDAFSGCRGLTSITIPNSVTSIGNEAFRGCSGLTSVTIPSSVTSIGYRAFYGNSLTSVTLNSNSIVSESYTFSSNIGNIFGTQVKEYIIGNSVTSIGDYAFKGCYNLSSVTIGESVASIGNNAFDGCISLTSVILNSNAIVSKSYTSSSNIVTTFGKQAKYIIGDGVTRIGGYAFCDCIALKSITIPNSVTQIGYKAFYKCNYLTSATIGNSITSIGSDAFSGCNITSINYTGSMEEWCKKEWAPSSISSNYELQLNGVKQEKVIIPNSITTIKNYAFEGCSSVASITIPNSVTSIGIKAFEGCNITAINFIGSIEDWCQKTWAPPSISSNYELKLNGVKQEKVIIPNSITTIKSHTFYGCQNLNSVTIPNSVTSIGEWAFYGCSGLKSVNIPDSVTNIERATFRGCSNLKNIELGDNIKSIGVQAFSECTSLDTLVIPNSVTSIGANAFYGCSSLGSISILEEVTDIGEGVFVNCAKLTDVTINSNVFGNKTFKKESTIANYFGKQVENFIIGDNVKIVNDYMFYRHDNIKSITIGKSVTSIGDSAFSVCPKLKTINWNAINARNWYWGDCYNFSPFYWVGDQITHFSIGSEVDVIPHDLFHGIFLDTITIPMSVKYIDQISHLHNFKFVTFLSANPCEIINTTGCYGGAGTFSRIVVPCGSIEAYKRKWEKYFLNFSENSITCPTEEIITVKLSNDVNTSDSWSKISTSQHWNKGLWLYYWGDFNEGPKFPGTKLTLTEDGQWYSYTFVVKFPYMSLNIIWNNAKDERNKQTQDITNIMHSTCYVIDGVSDGKLKAREIPCEKQIYTVTFVDWDGKVLKTEQVEYGKSASAPAEPKRDGYRFIGWDKDFSNVQSDMTITAQYSKNNANPITVRLDAESAKDWSKVRLYYWGYKSGDGLSITWPGITLNKDNNGWYSHTFDKSVNKVNIIWTDGTNQTVDITDVSNSTCYQLNSTNGKAITVSVVECTNKYTVTFVDWDGKVLKSEQVEHGKSATAPANPQRDGYRFIGWDKDFSNVQSDLTTTALYEQIEDGLDYHIDTQHLTQPTKVLIDGAVYILMPDGRMLNLQGAEVK